jgi:hypothetical protein
VLEAAALVSIHREHLDELVDKVLQVNPMVPVGVMCAAASSRTSAPARTEALLGDSFMGGFFAPPEKVADALAALDNSGVVRVELSPFSDAWLDVLAPHLFGR